MADKSGRKVSVTTLAFSTLGPGLGGMVPKHRGDWLVVDHPQQEGHAASGGEETAANSAASTSSSNPAPNEAMNEVRAIRPPPLKQSSGNKPKNGETQHQVSEGEESGGERKISSDSTSSVLSRLYSSNTTSSFGEKGRLNFKSKSGAGSISTMEQATLVKQGAQAGEDSQESPSSPDSKQLLQSQISPKNSIGSGPGESSTSAAAGAPELHRSSSVSNAGGLVPRAPTGSDWTRSNKGDRSSVGLAEFLKDLDRQAGEKQHRERVSSLQRDSTAGKPIEWTEEAVCNRHIWQQVDTREACHLADTQYCQQLKLFNTPKRQKLRCTACKVLVHETCVKQLYYEGYYCKSTFREIKQKVRETSTHHHFMHRRRADGRCQKCDRGFGNWKKFNLRDIVGISCSWCGDSYHTACFQESLRQQPCHLGPFRNLIIPPSWIVKVPHVEQLSSGPPSSSSVGEAKSTGRRKTRRSRRKKVDDRASKFFTVKPTSNRQHRPLLVFINPKSGGNQGAKLMQTFQGLLNPRQVFDLTQGGPEFGLKLYQGVSNLRILSCGGDGTAGWILSMLDKLDMRPYPPVAILPLGTGNDLARVFNWGGGYTDEPIEKILHHVEEGPVEEMDRWQLNVWENPDKSIEREADAVDDTPLHVINNYFSIGSDAQVAWQFHQDREANPEKYSSRYRNKMQYGRLAGKDLFQRKYLTMTDHLKLYADGEDLTDKIRSLRLEAICFLNITSYGSGTNPWGNPSSRDPNFRQQLMDDGKIEIIGFWTSTFPKLLMGAHGERIAHCEHIKLVMNKAYPVQIDGEAVKLQPSVIEVGLKNKANMVRKVAKRNSQAVLQGVRPSERIKLSVSKVTIEQYEKLHSDLHEIQRTAKALGLVVATAQDTLKGVRKQIEHFTYETDEDEENHLSKNWRYLDVATSGRVDRVFQVTPDQERTMLIGDMLSDGLLVVEFPPSPATTPASSSDLEPPLLTPVSAPPGEMPSFQLAIDKRKSFGRNASYDCATASSSGIKGLTPPRDGVLKNGLEVPPNPNLESSPSDTPPHSEDEAVCFLLPNIGDTGSDSNGTDNDATVSSTMTLRKGLFDAVKRGYVKKVQEMHSKGANLMEADSNGWTPLHHAARLDRKEVVRYLVDKIPKEGLDVVENEKLQTALHKAAWYGHFEVCKLLAEKGSSLTRKDLQGNTVYDKSMESDNKELQAYIKGLLNEANTALESNEAAI